MARLPDLNDLGQRPTPQPRAAIVQVRNPGAIGDAVEGLGDAAAKVGGQMLEREDKLNYAAAKSALLKADAETRQSLQDDPDYTTYEKRYADAMGKARTQAASLIGSKFDRRLFEVDTSLDMARGTMEVRSLAHTKQKASDIATGANTLEDLQVSARLAPDDGTREAAIHTANDTIQGMVDKGLLDPGKAMEARRDWHNRYVGGQIAIAIDKGDLEGARAQMARFGDKLDTQTFLQLSHALNDEHDAQAILSAANAGMGKPLVSAPADVPNVVKRLFPGAEVTSFKRTRVQQDALIAAGATAARNSHHLDGHAVDVKPIPGTTFETYVATLKANGVNVIEALDESGKGKNQGTGAHWHVAWTEGGGPKPRTVEDAVSTAIAALGPNATAAQIKGVRTEVVGRWQLQEAAEHDAEDGAVENVQQAMLKNGGNWYALPASLRNSVNPKYVPGLINYGEGLTPHAPARTTDPNEYVRLSTMAALDPKGFAAINPVTYHSKFEEGDWEKLVGERANILGKAGGDQAGPSIKEIRTVTAPLLASRGLTLTGLSRKDTSHSKAYDQTAGRIYQFEKAIAGDVAVWQQNNPGKKPTTQDIQSMADRRLLAAVQGGEDRLQFELTPGPAVVKIPAAARSRVASIMTGVLGRPPTDQEIVQAYLHEARGGS